MAAIQNKMGNQALDARLQRASSRRDELLNLVCRRLEKVRAAQLQELRQVKSPDRWTPKVYKGQRGFHAPVTTRWHETARCYKEAAAALCAGQLGRGVQLLERALEAERAAWRSLPRQVADKLREPDHSPPKPPAIASVAPDALCPATARPSELHIADLILATRDAWELVTPLEQQEHKMRRWWEGREEEEEEEDEEEDGH